MTRTASSASASELRDALRRHGVTDKRVRAAMERVPRAQFLPPELASHAAEDHSFTLEPGVDLVAPSVLGRLLDALDVAHGARTLQVGDDHGFSAAVLNALGATVTVLAPSHDAGRQMLQRFARLGLTIPVLGDPSDLARLPTFDRILIATPIDELPEAIVQRLAPGGALTALLRKDSDAASLVHVVRAEDDARVERTTVAEVSLEFRIGDLLVASGAVSREAVENVASTARSRLGQALLEQGLLHEADLYRTLAMQSHLQFMTAKQVRARMDFEVARSLPHTFVESHRLLPFRKDGNVVSIATSRPEASVSDVVKAVGAMRAEVFVVTPTDLRRIFSALHLGPAAALHTEDIETDDLLTRNPLDDAHLVALFEAMLLEAIGERASDIHLERYASRVRLRLRVDGDLREVPHIQVSPDELAGVVNVVKIAAGLDISERRLPQSGRLRRRAGDQVFDLRVQTQPSLHGEHVVIRLLPQSVQTVGIEELGFDPATAQTYRRLLDSPAGLVLVVGPTGCGKSTTLYAALQVLAGDPTRKVITVEDPIEYSIDNVQQSQVHPEIGFAFADAMRSFVRQDPDVILVGEIRDGETALEALRASQTGHVVLSTLHCNDAVDAVQRLLDLGMHPNSIASELLAVVAQRLAKRICTSCRHEAEPEPQILAELFPSGAPANFRCWKGRGCERCRGRGTYGRIATVELLRATPAIRRAIVHKDAVDDLRELALAEGMRTLRRNALWLVSEGVIPLSELPAMLSVERMGEQDPAD